MSTACIELRLAEATPLQVDRVTRVDITLPNGQSFQIDVLDDAIKIREGDLGYLTIHPEASNLIVVRRR